MIRFFLSVCSLLIPALLSAQTGSGFFNTFDCDQPSTFIKKLGSPQRPELAFSMCRSSDGGVYVAGRQGFNPMIAKLTVDGDPIWVRNFPGSPNEPVELAEIIEDSENKLLICGTQGGSPSSRSTIVLRYDPLADVVLWSKQILDGHPEASGIIEKSPGGNYILRTNSRLVVNGNIKSRSELLELDRSTGAPVPGGATKRYAGAPDLRFESMDANQGSLYGVGSWQLGSSQPLLAKISMTDGQPEWARLTNPDTTVSDSKLWSYADLVYDNGQLVIVGSGQKNAAYPVLGSYPFLEKHASDGTLLWLKYYYYDIVPEDVIALPNGYVIFGWMPGVNRWGMLKTDKNGNPLKTKRLITTPNSPISTVYANRQRQILAMGNHLFMVDHEQGSSNEIILLKTDLNLELDDACSLFLNAPPPLVKTMPAKSTLAVLPTDNLSATLIEKSTTFQADSLPVTKLCPQCLCVDQPDLALSFVRLQCSDGYINGIFELCNVGKGTLTGPLTVALYTENPFLHPAQLLQGSAAASLVIQPDSCILAGVGPLNSFGLTKYYVVTSLDFTYTQNTPFSLDTFPYSGGIMECNYNNNLDSFEVILNAPNLDLGPDRAICPGQNTTLDAGAGYFLYHWLNGPDTQTYNVDQPGEYIVEVTDQCGQKLRDTLQVNALQYITRAETLTLVPGDTVTIGGVAYTGPGVVVDPVAALNGGCDTLITYTLLFDSLYCPQPKSFLHGYDRPGKHNQGGILLSAADGTFYIGGDTDNQPFIMKTTASGQVLWSRNLQFLPDGNQELTALIEDSEGMLVGCGSRGGSSTSKRMYAFRYNPVTNQVLWLKLTASTVDVKADGILEEAPGGDFLLYAAYRSSGNIYDGEVGRLERSTGNLITGKMNSYRLLGASYFKSMVVHNGALYGVGEFAATPAAGQTRQGLAKIDLVTGNPVWATVSHVDTSITAELIGQDLLFDQDTIVSLAYGKESSGDVGAVFLQKTTASGQLLWVQRFTGFNGASSAFPIALTAVSNGYLFSVNAGFQLVIVKTDRNGQLLWARSLAKASSLNLTDRGTQTLALRGNDLYFVSSSFPAFAAPTQVLFGKLDENGNINAACSGITETTLQVSAVPNPGSQPIGLLVLKATRDLQPPMIPTTGIPVGFLPQTVCSNCESPCADVALSKTIQFYPGDTIVIDGTAYTQSDTVVQTFPTVAGCDSVVTNILQLIITTVDLHCPADLTVTLPLNSATTVVDYNPPTATTTCPDTTLAFTLVQGPPVGGAFPLGATLVCYAVANQCGIRDTCCFTITGQMPEQPCDVKSPPGCLRYELLNIRLDSLGQRRYRIRMVNTCASPLQYAYIQLPNGVPGVSPLEGATYTAPGGNSYLVRNPNASPFYSVRYKSVTGILNNGKNDVFEFSLPQQAAPAYIHVAAKLDDGSYSEAHLNTFDCPVQPYTGMRSAQRFPGSSLAVRPNPTDGMLFMDLSPWQEQTIQVQVLNAQGQLVLDRRYTVDRAEIALDLPAALVNGLYYLSLRPADGTATSLRFVLMR